MMRKLNAEEEKLEKEGLNRNKKDLITLKENYEYNKDLIDKQNYLRDHDDKWRDFLRRIKDEEDKNVLNTIQKEIDLKEELIKIANKNLKEGVEIKTSTAIG